MRARRSRWRLRLPFIASAIVAYAGQMLSGHHHTVLAAALAVLTVLAIRSRPQRWVLVMLLLHLGTWLATPAPATTIPWTGAVLTATGMFAVHALAPWLPWAPFEPVPEHRVLLQMGSPVLVVASLAAGVASLSATGAEFPRWGTFAAALCLLTVALVSLAPRLPNHERAGS